MLSDVEKAAVMQAPTEVLRACEQEMLTAIAVELAALIGFAQEEIEVRQFVLALKLQAIKRSYADKYHEALARAYKDYFTLNAINEF